MTTIALILAAGHGSRFDKMTPKQYHQLDGDIILNTAISSFIKSEKIDYVQVVIAEDHVDLYNALVKKHNKLLPVCFGGTTRQESSYLGLQQLQPLFPNKVLIHDAARPCLELDIISCMIEKLDRYKAVDLTVPVTDTVKFKEGNNIITLPRDQLYATQTPQGFDYKTILSAHQNALGSSATDDITLLLDQGYEIGLLEGSVYNNKITYQGDLPKKMRIGNGFDVHKFASDAGDHFVILGGVKIPHAYKILAHSDGDVALHALTDAVLGAIAEGDIGDHFPATDAQWSNVDSAVFLRHACNLVKQKGGIISNVDLTIVCQKPNISPYKVSIQNSIATIMNLSSSQISVKATTTEGLGFTGREEGIAVYAACLVNL